jgi:hypothetical protein
LDAFLNESLQFPINKGEVNGAFDTPNTEEEEVITSVFDGKDDGKDNDAMFPPFANEAPTQHVDSSSFGDTNGTPKSQNTEGVAVTTITFGHHDDGDQNTEEFKVTTVPFSHDDNDDTFQSETCLSACEPETSKSQRTEGVAVPTVPFAYVDGGDQITEVFEVTTVPFGHDNDDDALGSSAWEPENNGGESTARDDGRVNPRDDAMRALVGEV